MAKKKAATAATTTTAAPNMNQYEAMFLFGSAAAAEVDKSIATARGIIERHGGQVLVAKKWDERKLLYEIKGNKRGLYIITYFSAPGTAVAGIERDVNLSEEVVRVLVTDAAHLNKDEMEKVEPQPIQPREERNPWDKPDFNMPSGPRRDSRDDRGPRGPRREDAPAPEAAAKE